MPPGCPVLYFSPECDVTARFPNFPSLICRLYSPFCMTSRYRSFVSPAIPPTPNLPLLISRDPFSQALKNPSYSMPSRNRVFVDPDVLYDGQNSVFDPSEVVVLCAFLHSVFCASSQRGCFVRPYNPH